MNKYRDAKAFGTHIEHWVAGKILDEGLDVYLPMIDYRGVDLVVRRKNGTYIEIQVKARKKGAGIDGLKHTLRENYYFVFYSKELDTFWLLSSEEFLKESKLTMPNKGKKFFNYRTLRLVKRHTKTDKQTGIKTIWHTPHPDYCKYITKNFDRLKT